MNDMMDDVVSFNDIFTSAIGAEVDASHDAVMTALEDGVVPVEYLPPKVAQHMQLL